MLAMRVACTRKIFEILGLNETKIYGWTGKINGL
jgi:hypothetical protein